MAEKYENSHPLLVSVGHMFYSQQSSNFCATPTHHPRSRDEKDGFRVRHCTFEDEWGIRLNSSWSRQLLVTKYDSEEIRIDGTRIRTFFISQSQVFPSNTFQIRNEYFPAQKPSREDGTAGNLQEKRRGILRRISARSCFGRNDQEREYRGYWD